MHATQKLARFGAALSATELAPEVAHHAQRAVIDWYASIYPGLDTHRRALEAGDAEAMFLLSQSYAYGLGTRPALDAAQTWMVKAAEAGYPEAAQVLKLNNAGTEG